MGRPQRCANADLVLAMAARDVEGPAAAVRPPAELRPLRPFLDLGPFEAGGAARDALRARLACSKGSIPSAPWLVAVGMMRPGDKRARTGTSPRRCGRCDGAWQLALIGDGPAGPRRGAAFAPSGRTGRLARARDEAELPALLAAMDLLVWSGLNEAYGMAFLEAQAAGLPVVACARGRRARGRGRR